MGINSLSQINQISKGVTGIQPSSPTDVKGTKDIGPGFRDTFDKIHNQKLAKEALATQKPDALIFSKHAVERLQSRGITMGPESLSRLEKAFDKAQTKGAKDTLVLMDDSAFIMSVKNKTIVTAMDKAMLKENVFTNIDSTVIV